MNRLYVANVDQQVKRDETVHSHTNTSMIHNLQQAANE